MSNVFDTLAMYIDHVIIIVQKLRNQIQLGIYFAEWNRYEVDLELTRWESFMLFFKDYK